MTWMFRGRQKLMITVAAVGALAVAATVFVIVSATPTVTAELHVQDVDVTVSSPASRGSHITISRVPDLSDLSGITPLAGAVHVEVLDGEVRGETALVFTLRGPLAPGAVAVVATRTPESGWRTIAADYDPANRTIAVTATHFSDWVPGAVDKDQIERDLELQKRRDSTIGGGLARTIAGSTPALACVGKGPLVSVFINDATDLVKACMQVMGPGQPWRLEIVNGHAVPFKMSLPASVKAIPRDDGLQSLPNFVGAYYEKQNPGTLILPAESKRVFDVDPAGLETPIELHGSVEWSLLTFQLALFMINLAAKTDANAELMGGEKGDHWYETLDDLNAFYTCSTKSAESIKDAVLKSSVKDLLRAVGDVVEACKDTALSEWSNAASGAIGVAASRIKNLVSGRLNLITELGDTMAGVRSVMEGSMAGVAALMDALPGKAEALDIGVRLTKIVRPVPDGMPSCASYRVAGDFADLTVTTDAAGVLHWAIVIHYLYAGRWDVETYLDGEATGSNFHQLTNPVSSIYGQVPAEQHQIFKIASEFSTQDGFIGSRNFPNACYAP